MTPATRMFLLFAGVVAFAARGVGAQEPALATRLMLREAVEQAVAHYPGVRAALLGAEAAASAASAAAGARLPGFGVSVSASRYQEPMLVTPIHGFTPALSPAFDRDLFQGAAAIRYTVFDGLGRGARIDAARAESDASAHEVGRASQALMARVSATYLGILGSARVLEAQDRRIAALEAERARVRQLLEVGRAAVADLLRVEAVLAGAQAERVSLAAALDVGEQQLSRLTRLPVDRTRAAQLVPVTLRDTTLASRDALLAAALAANPAVLGEQRRHSAARARTTVARSERWPRLDVAASYMGWASAQDDPIAEWNVGVTVSWPLFTGGARSRQIHRSEAELAAAGERLRLAESDVAEELDAALSAAFEARARIASLVTAVARSEEVARIEQLRLDAGAGVQRDWLEAEAVLFANRAALVQARYGEILARVALARVTGRLDVDWLARNLGGTP